MPELTLTPGALAQIKQERLMRAYRDLFGASDGTRSETQLLVWEDLKNAGFARRPTYAVDKQGRADPVMSAHNDGKRWMFLYIEENAEFIPEAPKPEKPKRR